MRETGQRTASIESLESAYAENTFVLFEGDTLNVHRFPFIEVAPTASSRPSGPAVRSHAL
jgi:hypothetical protein